MEKEQVKALYDLLLSYPDEYVTQEAICALLPDYYPATINPKGGTTINRDIGRAVDIINRSAPSEYEKLIVGNNKRAYKIANAEECKEARQHQWKLIILRIKRVKHLESKEKLNGTVDLTEFLTPDQVRVLETLLPKSEKTHEKQDR